MSTTGELGGGGILAASYVNWSAALVALVPLGVVTVTSAVPAPAGEVAVICVELTTEKPAAWLAPKCTALASVKSVPVIVTLVPPAAGPDDGLTRVTVGGGTNVNRSAELVALVPPGVVTLTSCAPALPAGRDRNDLGRGDRRHDGGVRSAELDRARVVQVRAGDRDDCAAERRT